MPQIPQAELDPRSLFVEIACTSVLDDSDATERHCRHYEGRIATAPSEDGGEEVARFSYMDFDVIVQDRLEANDLAHLVMDTQSQETLDAFHAIQDNIHQVSDVTWVNRVVYLERLVVHPPYRGQGVARWWLAWILDHVGFGDATSVCVAVTPFPIDDDGTPLHQEKVLPEARADLDRRKQRLIALYESAGFQQLGDTDTWALGLCFQRPDPRKPR